MSALVSQILTDNPCSLSPKSIPIFIAESKEVNLGNKLSLKSRYLCVESLIDRSAKCVSIEIEYQLFDKMPAMVLWNVMMLDMLRMDMPMMHWNFTISYNFNA